MAWNPSTWFRSSRAFQETVDPSIDRANVRFLLPHDSALYIHSWSRRALNEKFEWVYQNFGVVKQALAGIARHTIGKGVSLQIDCEDDPGLIEAAEQDFENYALTAERCDRSGRRNFYEAQATGIEQRLGRGEFFVGLTENPAFGNEPCFHVYDTEEIADPPNDQAEGRRIIDGVELNNDSMAVAYWVRGLDGNFTSVPRGQMLHWFKPHAINQVRGITDFAQAINPLVDIHELRRICNRTAKGQQLLGVMLKGFQKTRAKGAYGAIQNVGVKEDGTTPDPNSAQAEQLMGAAGAGIFYVNDENGDVKIIESKTPNPLVEPYVTDMLLRDATATWGLPLEFFWKPDKLNGNTLRMVLAQSDLFFQIIGSQEADRFNTPVAYRYLSHRISIGALRPFKDPNWMYKMTWQFPPRVTVDNQREAEIMVDLMRNGMMTLRDFYNARGQSYKAAMRQWLREIKQFIDLAKTEGLDPKIIDRIMTNMPLWRAPEPGQGFSQQAPNGAQPPGNGSKQPAGGGKAQNAQTINIDARNGGKRSFKIHRADGTLLTGDITESENGETEGN